MGKSDTTKGSIFLAYKQIVTGASFKEATVHNIVDACSISRKTFYYHFSDCPDLVRWGFRNELANALSITCNADYLITPSDWANDTYPDLPFYARFASGVRSLDCSMFFRTLECYLEENRSFYRAILNSPADKGFILYLSNLYQPAIYVDIKYIAGGRKMPQSTLAQFTKWFLESAFAGYLFELKYSNRSLTSLTPDELPNLRHENLRDTINRYFDVSEQPYRVFNTTIRQRR